EFAGELTLLKLIPPGVDKTDCHLENEIRLSQRLLYDNSSPRPPEEFNSKNSNAEIESFSPSHIPIEDSDSFMEEIYLFLTPDDPMPPSIKDDEDSEGDILFLERLLHDDPIPLLDTLDFSYKVRIFLPFFTYPVTSPVLLSSGSEDKIFDPGITVNRIPENLKTLAKGFYPSSLNFLSFNWELYEKKFHILAPLPGRLAIDSRIWLKKEPHRSIFTWDDLVLKFINQFFPPSKTTNLCNEITNFQQRFNESFSEAWDRFKDLLRACPYHGFSELHKLDTFYNALNSKDQDSLNSAAGGNFLDKIPRECLAIIESKSKVRYSCNKPVVAKVSTNTSTSGISPDVVEFEDTVKALLFDKKSQNQAPAIVKAVKESYVTFGGAHSYRICPATNGNVYRDNI
nr:reverse transcriptase domain-containing protein [Tanacetum cinerariifolium]